MSNVKKYEISTKRVIVHKLFNYHIYICIFRLYVAFTCFEFALVIILMHDLEII